MHARATIGFGFTSDWLKKSPDVSLKDQLYIIIMYIIKHLGILRSRLLRFSPYVLDFHVSSAVVLYFGLACGSGLR